MIVDRVQLDLKAGAGGEGVSCLERLSSRRTVGGGGDGGKGGDVILRVDAHYYDLSKFRMKRKFVASDGERGREHHKKGKDAQSLYVGVPRGTIVRDLKGRVIVDLVDYEGEFLICKGGAGGLGNWRRKFTVPAQEGETKQAILDYRIFNDVAVIGFPNSGKTSLFNALTHKSYKVASYPFTTTSCVWAPLFGQEHDNIVVLDTPPLKREPSGEKEHFLKHLYRSKVILCLSDNFSERQQEFAAIKERIESFDPEIIKSKKFFYLLAKIDKIDKREGMDNAFAVSVKEPKGLDLLKKAIKKCLGNE
ncbi:MAG: 50S ribosome-binding GTPase [Candidatus Omnitrophota bacterium]|nr:MAG: 50S ribosome-binding GTPase [Candidatus Omnitrophota bacterium]